MLTLLSLIAGSADVISFLGLNGLFVSHITGNLVILAVQIVKAKTAPIGLILSVPVFIFILGLMKCLVFYLHKSKLKSLELLLLLQSLFLIAFLMTAVITAAFSINSNSPKAILAGMFGVAAMAVQNALIQLSFAGVPATAVMTTNITRFVIDVGEIILGNHPQKKTNARHRARIMWPTIIGFSAGCMIGAILENIYGPWSLIFPSSLAIFTLVNSYCINYKDHYI